GGAMEDRTAGRCRLQAGYGSSQSRLARSGFAYEADAAPVRHCKRDVIHGMESGCAAAECYDEILDDELSHQVTSLVSSESERSSSPMPSCGCQHATRPPWA